jgi:hypothetical protein
MNRLAIVLSVCAASCFPALAEPNPMRDPQAAADEFFRTRVEPVIV